jgi:hypothetical protein
VACVDYHDLLASTLIPDGNAFSARCPYEAKMTTRTTCGIGAIIHQGLVMILLVVPVDFFEVLNSRFESQIQDSFTQTTTNLKLRRSCTSPTLHPCIVNTQHTRKEKRQPTATDSCTEVIIIIVTCETEGTSD